MFKVSSRNRIVIFNSISFYMYHQNSIFFITGTSSSGKSTLTHYLKTILPNDEYIVYDFDECGVPSNPDVTWRQNTTNYWIAKALENNKLDKSTIICGVSVPSEVVNFTAKINIPIYFGFIKINDDIIRQRLQKRGWTDVLIEDNINWAHYLESEVKTTKNYLIVEAVDMSPKQVADTFIKWITSYSHHH